MRAGLHAQVRPPQRRPQIGGRGAAAPSLADRHLQAREAAGAARCSPPARDGPPVRPLPRRRRAADPGSGSAARAGRRRRARRRRRPPSPPGGGNTAGCPRSAIHPTRSRAPSGRSRPDGRARRPWHWWTSCRPPPCRARTRSRGHRRARPARRRSPSRAAASAGSCPTPAAHGSADRDPRDRLPAPARGSPPARSGGWPARSRPNRRRR